MLRRFAVATVLVMFSVLLGLAVASTGSGVVVQGNDGAQAIAKLPPIAIGAIRPSGEHLRAPRDEVVVKWLQDKGALPLNASPDQTAAMLREFKAQFAKKSDTWVSPEIQQWALQRESDLSSPKSPLAPLAIQPVTATVLAMAPA